MAFIRRGKSAQSDVMQAVAANIAFENCEQSGIRFKTQHQPLFAHNPSTLQGVDSRVRPHVDEDVATSENPVQGRELRFDIITENEGPSASVAGSVGATHEGAVVKSTRKHDLAGQQSAYGFSHKYVG